MERILKKGGKLIITVPFGRYYDYEWFIHYDKEHFDKLINSVKMTVIKKDFFLYKDNGWNDSSEEELKDVLYKDNNALAAAGLVCCLLAKTG